MSPVRLLLAAALAVAATPALAQIAGQGSESYKFLQAVKDAKGDEVTAAVEKPGSRIVNTRDVSSGQTALHIVVARGDETYTRYLLQHGADPNVRDAKGSTPLLEAVNNGQTALVPILIEGKANVNMGNGAGETPLIRAVQERDLALVRVLLAAGADPDQRDILAGMSARDYAQRDTRNPALAKVLADAPKRTRTGVVGPHL